ncbi:MAG: hypothetical protein PUB52_08440 [Lachnospiraceae bacterium]|nr:hypothetical protein [Lachnospiraceae bacterium]
MWSMMDLKSVRQVGSPQESDRIYIEEKAYGRLHREESSQKRCFILMGHNERSEDGYITVVESTFEVENISFEKGIPQWNTRVWSEVFEEVKTRFEDMVILGWALDLKGKMAVVSPELELVHKEQFGGVRQILFVMDTLEQEEAFYRIRNNRLLKQNGFMIYQDGKKTTEEPNQSSAVPPVPSVRAPETKTPRYREIYREDIGREKKREKEKGKESGNGSIVGVVAIVVLLLAILGTGILQNRISLEQLQDAVETIKEMEVPTSSGENAPEAALEVEGEPTETVETNCVTVEKTTAGDIFESNGGQ